jgi:hypothetical protein
LVCAGKQVVSGGTFHAPFVVKASTSGDSKWTVEAGWQGKAPFVSAGVACGEILSPDKTCTEKMNSSGIFSLTQTCGPMISGGGVPRSEYISTIVLGDDRSYGYFNCQGTGISQHIELVACQNQ